MRNLIHNDGLKWLVVLIVATMLALSGCASDPPSRECKMTPRYKLCYQRRRSRRAHSPLVAQVLEAIAILESGTDYEGMHVVSILRNGLSAMTEERQSPQGAAVDLDELANKAAWILDHGATNENADLARGIIVYRLNTLASRPAGGEERPTADAVEYAIDALVSWSSDKHAPEHAAIVRAALREAPRERRIDSRGWPVYPTTARSRGQRDHDRGY